MDIDSFEILLTGVLASAVSLIFFVYLGKGILDFLKIPAPKQMPLKRRISNEEALNAEKKRRRIVSKPGIICSLPMHQASRQEAPLF